ncbi:MAG: hypothetical protein AAFW60_06445 [Pseudomonadota bacterium]
MERSGSGVDGVVFDTRNVIDTGMHAERQPQADGLELQTASL